jgi:type I restriction enzyme R subunit
MFDGKTFTIYDFVDAYHHFADPGGMVKQNLDVCVCECSGSGPKPQNLQAKARGRRKKEKRKPIRIKLRDGRIGDSTHDVYFFLSADGKPISVEEFLNNLFGHYLIFQKRRRTAAIWKPYDP